MWGLLVTAYSRWRKRKKRALELHENSKTGTKNLYLEGELHIPVFSISTTLDKLR